MPLPDIKSWLRRWKHAPSPTNPQAGIDDIDGWESPNFAIAFGQRVILIGLGGFSLWAAFAPLDEGVPAPGLVAVENRRSTIIPLVSGTIATLPARENLRVEAGDILATLEGTQQEADYQTAVQQHFAAAVKLARLEAEQNWEGGIKLPEELQVLDREGWAAELLSAQANLLTSRHASLANELEVLRAGLAAQDEQLRGAREQLTSRKQQLDLIEEQLKGLTSLVDAGYSSRNELMDMQKSHAEFVRLTSELQTATARAAVAVGEIRLRIVQLRKDFQRGVEAEIVDTRKEVALAREHLKAAKSTFELTRLKAPFKGQVVALSGIAPGTIVNAGIRLMDVLPDGNGLLLDVQIPPHLVNRVQVGLPSEIRIHAFPEDPQLVIDGRVQSISNDSLQDTATSSRYYLARLEITPLGLQQLGSRTLRPGMPVEAIIKTGERSFLAYLTKPLTQRLFSAFREN